MFLGMVLVGCGMSEKIVDKYLHKGLTDVKINIRIGGRRKGGVWLHEWW